MMAKIVFVFSIIVAIVTTLMPWTHSHSNFIISKHDSQNHNQKKTTITQIQFYFHDNVSGKAPTAIRLAQATTNDMSATLSGSLVIIIDDLLTETPDPKSKEIGRAQGLYGSVQQKDMGLLMALNYEFTAGEFNGSSFYVMAKNPLTKSVREFPIVGGTGVFRMGRGYALTTTYWSNTLGDAIVGYNVTIFH